MEGAILKVHVLAAFLCDRCGGACNRLTVAPVVDGRIVEPAERPGTVVCNACTQEECNEDARQQRAKVTQAQWATGKPRSPYKPHRSKP